MASIRALKAIDKLLRDLMKNNIPFGGKVFVMGGDFRQTPPVVHKGSRAKIVENSIKSYVSQNFEVFELTKNMRADPKQNKFAKWLLEVGNGLKDMGEDLVKMPNECIVKGDLIEDMYKDVKSNEDLKEICCLSPKNVFVDEMNKEI